MKAALAKLRQDLGLVGLGALLVLAATALVHVLHIKPLETRLKRVDEELQRVEVRAAPDGFKRVSADSREDRVGAFYKFFERPERTEDWLAKLYAVAVASGLELNTADYRLSESRQRIDRYQISLPVTGTYTQMRAFLENALVEIPVLSLDHASFKRKATNEARIDAEIVLTLHLLRK